MHNLPKTVRDIIDLVGLPATMALVNAYPGICVKVPTGAREEGVAKARFISIMGMEAAEQFIATYGGERLTIPRCAAALRDERNRAIIADYDGGKSVSELVMRYVLTERQIRTILNTVPGDKVAGLADGRARDDSQMALF